ncbi:hypothetical protein M3J09_009301 [Ascochyta lentis]
MPWMLCPLPTCRCDVNKLPGRTFKRVPGQAIHHTILSPPWSRWEDNSPADGEKPRAHGGSLDNSSQAICTKVSFKTHCRLGSAHVKTSPT